MQEMLVLGKNAPGNCPGGMAMLPPCPLTSHPSARLGRVGAMSQSNFYKHSRKSLRAHVSGTGVRCLPHWAEGEKDYVVWEGGRLTGERKGQGHCLTSRLKFCLRLPVAWGY